MLDLILTPSGHLRSTEVTPPGDEVAGERAAVRALAAAFGQDPGEGLLRLATLPPGEELSPVLTYWKRFARDVAPPGG